MNKITVLEFHLKFGYNVILLPRSFKSLTFFNELKLMKNPIEFFTDSLWAITWKTNEVETFRLSKIGKITWIQKSKHRKVRKLD